MAQQVRIVRICWACFITDKMRVRNSMSDVQNIHRSKALKQLDFPLPVDDVDADWLIEKWHELSHAPLVSESIDVTEKERQSMLNTLGFELARRGYAIQETWVKQDA